MNKEMGKRMCWSCDGDVPMQLSQCPYCRAFLKDPCENNSSSSSEKFFFESPSCEFSSSAKEWNEPFFNEEEERVSQEATPRNEPSLSSVSSILLTLGITFGLLGLRILLSGPNGLTLHWNRNASFFLLLSSAVILWKSLHKRKIY